MTSTKVRVRTSKYSYRPEIGVKSDFEKLLQRFSSAGTVRYAKFAEIWRDMKLSLYCAGRQTMRESREFVEECFKIAVQFWLPPSSFLVRAGALYLLYGLYYFQLVAPNVKIRLTPQDWLKILEFQAEAREQQHLDLDYVFQKLLIDKAFVFAATQDEILPNTRETDDSKIVPDTLKEETSSVDEVFSSTALNQLALVHDQYQKIKIALNGKDATIPDSSLNIAHPDFILGIYKTLQVHREKCNTTQSQKSMEVEPVAVEEKKGSFQQKDIKKKAYQTSLGFYKRSKRKQRSSFNQADSGMDSSSQDEKGFREETRGRKRTVDLFEADDVALDKQAPVTDSQPMIDMPDLEDVIPKLASDKNTDEPPATTSKGKATQKTKGRKKSRDTNTDQSVDIAASAADTTKETDSTVSKTTGNADDSRKSARKSKRKLPTVVTRSPPVAKSRKVRSKGKTTPVDPGDSMADSQDVSKSVVSKTAQQKLTDKLNQRKKAARQTKHTVKS